MADLANPGAPDLRPRAGLLARIRAGVRQWRNALTSDPLFQARAVANPLLRPVANRQGAALYDLVAGFAYSQTLYACVELDLFRKLKDGRRTAVQLSHECSLPPEGMRRLLQAAAALDLVQTDGDDGYVLGPLGAAVLGAPGVEEMVRHHPMFYRDIEDPVALLSGQCGETELSAFWDYVKPGGGDPEKAASYSRLMAVSQRMVAEETLAVAPMGGITRLLDVGGGEGAFLEAALGRHAALAGAVFDLPEVATRAARRFAAGPLGGRARVVGGSFLNDPLPSGFDAISLIRVLYDHDDATVDDLLSKAHAALPPGGKLILSEPMSGGTRPNRTGDAYFGLYTAAMTSGTPRSPEDHTRALRRAGFRAVSVRRPRQAFITRVILATRG